MRCLSVNFACSAVLTFLGFCSLFASPAVLAGLRCPFSCSKGELQRGGKTGAGQRLLFPQLGSCGAASPVLLLLVL